jgi:hypothetical protein
MIVKSNFGFYHFQQPSTVNIGNFIDLEGKTDEVKSTNTTEPEGAKAYATNYMYNK